MNRFIRIFNRQSKFFLNKHFFDLNNVIKYLKKLSYSATKPIIIVNKLKWIKWFDFGLFANKTILFI
jgi:hypothetical protein